MVTVWARRLAVLLAVPVLAVGLGVRPVGADDTTVNLTGSWYCGGNGLGTLRWKLSVTGGDVAEYAVISQTPTPLPIPEHYVGFHRGPIYNTTVLEAFQYMNQGLPGISTLTVVVEPRGSNGSVRARIPASVSVDMGEGCHPPAPPPPPPPGAGGGAVEEPAPVAEPTPTPEPAPTPSAAPSTSPSSTVDKSSRSPEPDLAAVSRDSGIGGVVALSAGAAGVLALFVALTLWWSRRRRVTAGPDVP